jgi:L-seryl-tRNA(Ser) seleniumtransferase
VGGGALPLAEPESFAVALAPANLSADDLDARLRACDPPIVARIEDGRVLLDVRCLADADVRDLSEGCGAARME